MDEPITRPKVVKKRFVAAASLLLAMVVIVYVFAAHSNDDAGARRLSGSSARVVEVRREKFSSYLLLRGTISPKNAVFLDAVVDGRVEEAFVEEGQLVTKGQPLIRLANTQLQLEIISREAEVTEQINNLRNTRLQMEQQDLDLRTEQAEVDYELAKLARTVAGNAELVKKGGVALRNSQDSADELKYLQRRRELLIARQQTNALIRQQQIGQLQTSVDQLTRNLQVARDVLENLTFRSPSSGLLSALDPKLGEYVRVGNRIGRIDIGGDFQIEAQVDEYHLTRMRTGLRATAEINGSVQKLVVTKIYSQIEAGRFRMDLSFEGKPPKDMRRGQAVNFRVQVDAERESLVLPREGVLESALPERLFVEDPNGGAPIGKSVRYGDSNPERVEVLEGLSEGDRVLVGTQQGK